MSTAAAYLFDDRLTSLQKTVAAALDSLSKGKGYVAHACRTLADHLGVAVRSVQAAIKALIAAGHVERRTDYTLRTRRRLLLRWQAVWQGEPPVFPSMAVEAVATVEPEPAPAPTQRHAPPDVPSRAEPCRGRADDVPTPDLVERAATVMGEPAEARVAEMVRDYGAAWSARAIDVAERKNVCGPRVSWGYLFGTLKAFRREGGPSARTPKSLAESARESRESFDAFLVDADAYSLAKEQQRRRTV